MDTLHAQYTELIAYNNFTQTCFTGAYCKWIFVVYGFLQNELLMYLLSYKQFICVRVVKKFKYSQMYINQAEFNHDFNIFTVVIFVLAIVGNLFLPFRIVHFYYVNTNQPPL